MLWLIVINKYCFRQTPFKMATSRSKENPDIEQWWSSEVKGHDILMTVRGGNFFFTN